jgi:hypothetical protein
MSRPPLTRKLTQREQKVRAGHTDICDGVRPFRLRGRPIGGGDHDLLTDINDLQQEILDEARCGGGESFARMLEALKADKKLSAELEGAYFEKYEAGLRRLKDDLSIAILAEEDEQDVDTLGGIFRHLARALASASPEVKQRTVECLPDEFGVRLACSVDIETMLVEVDSPGKKKRSWDSPGTAEGSQAKRKESSESNDVASNVNHQGSDDVEGEGEDRNPADDDVERPNISTRSISSSTPAPAPAPTPRVSRTAVHVYMAFDNVLDASRIALTLPNCEPTSMMRNWLTLQPERERATGWRGQEKGRSAVAVREQKLAPESGHITGDGEAEGTRVNNEALPTF